jgi:hypothetical protein
MSGVEAVVQFGFPSVACYQTMLGLISISRKESPAGNKVHMHYSPIAFPSLRNTNFVSLLILT